MLTAVPSTHRKLWFAAAIVLVLASLLPAAFVYFEYFGNQRVEAELLAEPQGARAERVMLLTLPSGRRIPVNYLREGEFVYAAADGGWDVEFANGSAPVEVYVRGETLRGVGRAVEDDPEYTKDVFSRLRPNALPGFGTLIEVRITPPTEDPARTTPAR